MSANNPGGDTIAVGCCESNGTAKDPSRDVGWTRDVYRKGPSGCFRDFQNCRYRSVGILSNKLYYFERRFSVLIVRLNHNVTFFFRSRRLAHGRPVHQETVSTVVRRRSGAARVGRPSR